MKDVKRHLLIAVTRAREPRYTGHPSHPSQPAAASLAYAGCSWKAPRCITSQSRATVPTSRPEPMR